MAETILFLSSAFKGEEMIRAVKQAGCRVLLLIEEALRHEPWPHDSIDETFYMPDLRRYQDVIHAISYLARDRVIDAIFSIDEFEVELAAILREHLRLTGLTVSHIRNFRDKLAMRQQTQAAGLNVPDFIHVLNYDKLRAFMDSVPTPWMLKPRSEAGSMGITKCHSSEDVWRALDRLGDRQSYYLLERFIPGEVFHVDALTLNDETLFVSTQQYGAPPFTVYHGGGVFNTRMLPRDSQDAQTLVDLNARVLKAVGIHTGASHAEFIKSGDTFYFLEVAGRVGGAFISDLIEKATNVNLWREWGRLEVALLRGEPYVLPEVRHAYGGLLVTLARQEYPDLSSYSDPEIVWKANKPNHAGLIVVSPDAARVAHLLNDYARRFAEEFMQVAAPMDATRTGQTG